MDALQAGNYRSEFVEWSGGSCHFSGGSNDIAARLIGLKLNERWGAGRILVRGLGLGDMTPEEFSRHIGPTSSAGDGSQVGRHSSEMITGTFAAMRPS